MNIKHKQSIFEVSDNYTNFLVDIWGVIHDGVTLFRHVKETLLKLKKSGKEIIFLSNSPRRSAVIQHHFLKFGITTEYYHDIYTSGEDAFNQMINHAEQYPFLKGKAYIFTDPLHDSLLADCQLRAAKDIHEASFIFNSAFDDECDLQGANLDNLLSCAIAKSLPMICVNPDLGAINGGVYSSCAGTLAHKYENMGGKVYYHGKPFPAIYEGAMQRFTNPIKSKTIAIGDTIRTDIEGACRFGIDSILVLSGIEMHHADDKTLAQILDKSDFKPTYCLDELQ